jgi:transaldolase/glucose-6-phosphate isomerase
MATPKSSTPAERNLPQLRLSPRQRELVEQALEAWDRDQNTSRLWQADASLWTGDEEAQWLGWLDIVDKQLARLDELQAFADEVKLAGFTHLLLLGMGGSSLGPEVLALTFGRFDGFPRLHVLDSTDPTQVRAFEQKVDLAKTLILVSSKSGSTLEPTIFEQYFFDRVARAVGKEKAAAQFVAITDPGSQLETHAREAGYRRIFRGLKTIGGRYSVLSDFGMVPAAAIGINVQRFLERARRMAGDCSVVPAGENPGVLLGVILAVLAKHEKRDKVTIVTSPQFHDLGAWLEQLLAESTGKQGNGLIPVDREPLGPPEVYGDDRVFVYVRSEAEPDENQEQALSALEQAGQPVLRLALNDAYDLGAEFFRWEIATAVAGAIQGINPFDQPDVEASKVATKKLTSEYEKTGSLPEEEPLFSGYDTRLFTDAANAAALRKDLAGSESLVGYMRAHLSRLRAGDYFVTLAYIEMNPEHEEALAQIRQRVRGAKRVATCLGFGPRFLHSTGQAYKGGPASGVFLQITCDDAADLAVPGRKYTFGAVKAAQARGDFEVLAARNRRALRVHLSADIRGGLAALDAAVEKALES